MPLQDPDAGGRSSCGHARLPCLAQRRFRKPMRKYSRPVTSCQRQNRDGVHGSPFAEADRLPRVDGVRHVCLERKGGRHMGGLSAAGVASGLHFALLSRRRGRVSRSPGRTRRTACEPWDTSRIPTRKAPGKGRFRTRHARMPPCAAPARFLAPAGAAVYNGATRWGCSSIGRARHSHCRGRGFESPHLHHLPSGLRHWRLRQCRRDLAA
jgi:hypothetical protein